MKGVAFPDNTDQGHAFKLFLSPVAGAPPRIGVERVYKQHLQVRAIPLEQSPVFWFFVSFLAFCKVPAGILYSRNLIKLSRMAIGAAIEVHRLKGPSLIESHKAQLLSYMNCWTFRLAFSSISMRLNWWTASTA